MTDTKLTIDGDQRREIVNQINRMTLLSISGGRVKAIQNGIELPVGSGYSVRIELTAADDYTVSRIFRRGAKEWVKGSRDSVYCDEVSEVAYFASSFRSYDENEWMGKV